MTAQTPNTFEEVGKNSVSELSSACKGALQAGLMTVDENGRYKVDHEQIERLKVLNQLRKN